MKALIFSVLALSGSAASADIMCDCHKIWKGGPAHMFYGQVLNAGTVVGDDHAEALETCRATGRVSFYNPKLSNCTGSVSYNSDQVEGAQVASTYGNKK